MSEPLSLSAAMSIAKKPRGYAPHYVREALKIIAAELEQSWADFARLLKNRDALLAMLQDAYKRAHPDRRPMEVLTLALQYAEITEACRVMCVVEAADAAGGKAC